jgi:Domain of unknown function (DUF4159)
MFTSDPDLFQCPYVLVEDGGSARFSDEEVVRLREYLEEGGFIFASDAGARAPASNGTKRLGACCRRRSIPSSIFPPTIRSGRRCSSSRKCRRWRRFSSGAVAAASPSAGRTLHRRGKGYRRCARPADGGHDPQQRHPRRLGARGRGSAVLLQILTRCLLVGIVECQHQSTIKNLQSPTNHKSKINDLQCSATIRRL